MPLIRVDMIEGRKPEEINGLLDAIQRTVITAFNAPVRDRYQIVHEHPQSRFLVEDTGLGITRTRNCIVIQVTTRPHERQAKVSFYQQLANELEEACGLAPSDLVVCIVSNTDEDWSFGYGRAQYLTGELAR
jgi:phenylpyruvate tautomerase PptA (4-oxalocrotonate tautomerase family)